MGLDGLEWALVGALDGAFTIGVADELMDHTAVVCKASSRLRLVSLFFSFSSPSPSHSAFSPWIFFSRPFLD